MRSLVAALLSDFLRRSKGSAHMSPVVSGAPNATRHFHWTSYP